MSAQTIFTTLIVSLLVAIFSAWLSIEIKFSRDKAEAKNAAKLIIIRVGWLISNIFLMYIFFKNLFITPLPLTTVGVVFIILPLLSFSVSFTIWWSSKILKSVEQQSNILDDMIKMQKLLQEQIRHLREGKD